jgi:hypothetical protein
VVIDGQQLVAPPPQSDRSWTAHFRLLNGRWYAVDEPFEIALAKRPGLQGPIDDAFLGKFIVVRPTGKPLYEATGRWVETELAHFVEHWRSQFRGEIKVRDDVSITDEEISDANLILWGDPASNKLIASVAPRLPLQWNASSLDIAGEHFDSSGHLPALIYPNPLAPARYVVLNSGFTYREYDYLNNARQVPKLPDWAVLNTTSRATSRRAAEVKAAGFFGESWEVTAPH